MHRDLQSLHLHCTLFTSHETEKRGKGEETQHLSVIQLSVKPHSALSVLAQSIKYILHQLIFLQTPNFPLPLKLYPNQSTTAMLFAVGSSNKPS